jgi:predicted dehydrogenase
MANALHAPAPLAAAAAPVELASRPLRVAVVGAGAMGRRHARVLASRPDRFALTCVMDVDAVAARALAGDYGTAAVLTEADALAPAEAIVVATPMFAHAETVRRALARGKHVLVEKPLAASPREAANLVALASSSAARLFVGHSERFNPVVRALARLVDPSMVTAVELRRVGPRQSPRVDAASAGSAGRPTPEEGALVNLGVHDLDLAAYLTRSPLVVRSAVGELTPSGLDERAHVLARSASGAAVLVFVDQRPADALRRRTLTLSTPTHVWHGDLLAPSLVRACRSTGAREAIPLDTEEPLLAQAMAFLAAVRGAPCSEIATARDGLLALAAAERASAQVRGPRENLPPSPRC